MLKGWLIYNESDASRNQAYIDWFLQEASHLGIQLDLILKEDFTYGVKEGKLYIGSLSKELILPDFCVMRHMDELLTLHLEALGVKVFNNSNVAGIANDKARTCQYLSQHGIPMPDTVFVSTDSYREEHFSHVTFPVVVKAVRGRGGSEVFQASSLEELTGIIRSDTTHPADRDRRYVVQEMVQPGKDVRVFVVGQQIVGAVLRESDVDFRANHSLGGRSSLYLLSDEEREQVNQVIELFDIGLAGIDFIFGQDGVMLMNEVEDVVGSRTLSLHSDINLVRIYLEHIREQME